MKKNHRRTNKFKSYMTHSSSEDRKACQKRFRRYVKKAIRSNVEMPETYKTGLFCMYY